MFRFLVIASLFASLSGCNLPAEQESGGQSWRASNEHGDRPGIGYELRNDNGKISGDAYILDPDFPHDFSHGRRAAMKIADQSPGEVTFRVKWDRDLKATLRFQFKEIAWPDSFPAVVTEIIGTDSYDSETYNFKRIK